MTTKTEHTPIMTKEILALLDTDKEVTAIDCTLGTGGHTFALLDKVSNSKILAIDLDEEQIDYVFDKAIKHGFTTDRQGIPHPDLWGWRLYDKKGNTLFLIKNNFMFCGDTARKVGITYADLMIFDLGYSTYQLKEGKRGLSYEEINEEILDQRYSLSEGWKATDLINVLSAKELAALLREYGEEKKSKEIADAIVLARKIEPIETNTQLSNIIRKAVGYSYEPGKHPAMRTFQALRIAVNNELVSLASALPQALDLIAGDPKKDNGKIAILSFNSLEQRVIDKTLKSDPTAKLVKQSRPSVAEVAVNPRSHSAVLYVLQRTKA